jgi:hypothetical protein
MAAKQSDEQVLLHRLITTTPPARTEVPGVFLHVGERVRVPGGWQQDAAIARNGRPIGTLRTIRARHKTITVTRCGKLAVLGRAIDWAVELLDQATAGTVRA